MLESSVKNITLGSYIKDLENKAIDLEPEYQRNFIWGTRLMVEYLTSLYNGMAPTMFVINNKNKSKRIIDGKQRSTSIHKFANNEFPIMIGDTPYYYSKVPEGINNGKLLKKEKKEEFKKITITVKEYENLSFKEETQIFNLLQNGVSLRPGEKVLGYITDVKKSLEFNKIAESLSEPLKNFCNTSRRDHHMILLQYLNFNQNSKLSITLDDCKKCLQELEKTDELSDGLNKAKTELLWIMDILNDDSIKRLKDLKKKKVFYTVIFGLRMYKSLLDNKTIKKSYICDKIKRFIGMLSIDLSDRFAEVTKELLSEFQSVMEKFLRKYKSCKSNKNNNEDEDDDKNEDDNEDDESENKLTHENKKEKNKSKKVKKNNKTKIKPTKKEEKIELESEDEHNSEKEDSDEEETEQLSSDEQSDEEETEQLSSEDQSDDNDNDDDETYEA